MARARWGKWLAGAEMKNAEKESNEEGSVVAVSATMVPYADVKKRIVRVRGQPVIIDADVAELYGVQVKRLNEQVRRNLERFPESFMFQLTASEINDLKSQIATSSPDDGMERLKSQIATSSWGGVRKPPKAFTEKGLYMLATVLKSKQATAATFAINRDIC